MIIHSIDFDSRHQSYGIHLGEIFGFEVAPASLTTNDIPTIPLLVPLSVVATAAGQAQYPLSYQWKFNGNVNTNVTGADYVLYLSSFYSSAVPLEGDYEVTVTNVVGSTNVGPWRIRILFPGMVAAWGKNTNGECDRPIDLTNTLSIAAGELHSVAVRDGGSVVQWGYNWGSVPANLTNAAFVAAGYSHTLALKNDLTVAAWGGNALNQTNVPSELTNVVGIAASGNQSLALKSNGTVTNWGESFGSAPANLTNAMAIACGTNFSVALRSNSTVTAWGNNSNNQTNVPSGLTNVVGIAAGGLHALALKLDGTVVAWGKNANGQTNVPAGLSNVLAVAAGWAHSVALKNDGTMVAWGDNSHGQTNVPGTLTDMKLIAAGGDHTLAAVFSPLVTYPVDVSKDLLLIYNTNSLDSSNVCAYYLQHRPMVSNANVLGVGCPARETMTPDEFTNQFAPAVAAWLEVNPTKRPQYTILFYDVPTRVNSNTTSGIYPVDQALLTPSVSHRLNHEMGAWHPFVNYINFATTNDCMAYIDKLKSIGTNYSPGKLFISARAGGYANTNYYFDGLAIDYEPGKGALLSNAVVSSGVSPAAITAVDGTDFVTNHITQATNVAGYFSYGGHSSLGSTFITNIVQFYGQSKWFVMGAYESYNGVRDNTLTSSQAPFLDWFSPIAFGGTIYENTPVGAVANSDECGCNPDHETFFRLWASGKNLGISSWNARSGYQTLGLGDPLVVH